ncbi:RagB/SusD family nutrient uptake outer membrane protein [Sphingobacterium detergens]|uniref:Putative outer membrane starch-binding protein n=1 Tax=Sphingobacterium detergens TaxID=1145106 RepID=A0A420BKI8_SPHD1|nr:RagB/SusD family nutrient uptake outer membrane protein [Sphingobacterium detergens]RKE57301.1 putative outer membrane starch-binding protein [Sphingobacterium detergens]
MKKLIYIYGTIVLFTACNKRLDLDPLSNASEATYFRNPEEAGVGLNAVYATLPGERDFWKDCSSDNSIMTNAWGEGGLGFINQGSQQASDTYLREEYVGAYGNIRRALYYLTKLTPIDFGANAALKTRYEAEARFVLAMWYFRLVEHFGDVPLIVEQPVLLDESKIPRSPKQQVLEYALQCVNFSAANLPTSYSGSDNGRITKAAALMLRANIYLYMASWEKFHNNNNNVEYWQNAANAADSVVALNQYTLVANYASQFTAAANNANSEIILARQYVKDLVTHMLPTLASPGGVGAIGGGWAAFCPTRDLIDSYECTDGRSIRTSPLYNVNRPYENRDRRLTQTFMLPGIPVKRPDGSMTPFSPHPSSGMPERIGNEGGGGKTGYMYLKFNDLETITPERSFINWPIYRYAETLLILAEALNEANPGDARIKTSLDLVRQRAGLPVVDPSIITNQDAVRNIIRNERRHEFVAEHKRYFDILRWKIAEDVLNTPAFGINSNVSDPTGDYNAPKILAQQRKFTAPLMYLWPIPQSVIDANNLIIQNAGW